MYENRRHDRELDEIEYITFYIELTYEEYFAAIESGFDFGPATEYSVHYMDKGELLDAAKEHSPDIELSEAAHDRLISENQAPKPSVSEPKRSYDPNEEQPELRREG